MKTFKTIVTLLIVGVLFVCCVGGAATLYYCDIESSNFFATGVLALGGFAGYVGYPKVKSIIKGDAESGN